MKDVTIATATNASFLIAGLAIYSHDFTLWPVSIWCLTLALGSGFHHLNLGKRYIDNDISILFDYFPMYGLFSMLSLSYVLPGKLSLLLSLISAIILTLWLGKSNVGIGIIGAVLVVLMAIFDGFEEVIQVLPWFAVAFGFNYLGDNVHNEHHNILHGTWHIVIAYPIYLIAI